MSTFTDRQLDYLREWRPERLGRIATVGKDGTPHVVPVGGVAACDAGCITDHSARISLRCCFPPELNTAFG